MKVILSAVAAACICVVVLLLVSEWRAGNERRADLRQVAQPAAEQEPASRVITSYEAAAARMKHCNINAVIYHALQSTGGAGPICVME
jgi:hypothetical protein